MDFSPRKPLQTIRLDQDQLSSGENRKLTGLIRNGCMSLPI